MASVTTGAIAPTTLRFDDGNAVTVQAPGVALLLETVAAPPGIAMEDAAPGEGVWDDAIGANELTQKYQPIQATPVPTPAGLAAAPAATLSMPGSDDAHVQFEATPDPGEGLLLMVRNGDIVQWFIPLNASSAVPDNGTGVLELAAAPVSTALRFRVPQSALTSPAGASPAGFSASSFGGAVLRFFRFSLVKDILQDIVDGAVERVVAWIANKIEARSKTEAFLSFDPEHNFPVLKDLSGLSGRTLLLTHGIFSSTQGAFAAFGKAGHPLLADFRSKYKNIIGWDHYTVSKTPFQNAQDLLNRLPDGMQIDVICHSRGALVTRAMLEDPALAGLAKQKIGSVGNAIFVAGANQGSQLARFENINRLLNIYSAIGSIPILGSAGVVLNVIVGLLRVLAHGAVKLPSVLALNPDPSVNAFLKGLNGPTMTQIGRLVVLHANYDPTQGLLREYLDWNVDQIFGTANDLVVPFTGAEVFDPWLPVADVNNYRFGTATVAQNVVLHTNFFYQQTVQDILQQHT